MVNLRRAVFGRPGKRGRGPGAGALRHVAVEVAGVRAVAEALHPVARAIGPSGIRAVAGLIVLI
jgi:hypothetical protein